MRISEYPAITKFTEDNIMLVDGNSGTKTIKIADAILAALHMTSVTNHRLVFRGKNLGSAVTTEQLAAIQAGTFEGLWLGDYWVINGVTWRIADFDYWYGKGENKCTKHHLIIVPDTSLSVGKMNDAGTTAGGYIGSTMYTSGMEESKNLVSSAFGSAIISHQTFFTNAESGGKPSSGAWVDSTVDLMNEYMVYGHAHAMASHNGTNVAAFDTIDTTQLALFSANPEFIRCASTWLRDIVSATQFATAHPNGSATVANADWQLGVRPVFAIG